MILLKHALSENGGTISLFLKPGSANLCLTIADDGYGMRPHKDTGERQGSGTGVQLIESLAQPIEATLQWPEVDRGTKLIVKPSL